MSKKTKRAGLKMTLIFRELEITDGKVKTRASLTYGVCAKCGCTDFDCSGCLARTGERCSWVDDKHTLCTACA